GLAVAAALAFTLLPATELGRVPALLLSAVSAAPEGADPVSVEDPVAPATTSAEPQAAEPQVEEKPARTRRRATRTSAAPAQQPVFVAADEVAAPRLAEQGDAPAEQKQAEEKPARGRRRATRTSAAPTEAASEPRTPAGDSRSAPGNRSAEERPAGNRRSARPAAGVVFQPPVFRAPMFQTPESAAAEAARAAEERAAQRKAAEVTADEEETEEDTAGASVDTGTDTDEDEHGDNGERSGRRRRRGGRRRRRSETAQRAAESGGGDADADDTPSEATGQEDEAGTAEETGGNRRSRRRGNKAAAEARAAEDAADETDADADTDTDTDDEPDTDADDDGTEGRSGGSSSRRRRRRRRRGSDADDAPNGSEDDPERTVVKVREPRRKKSGEPQEGSDGVQSIKGSTRLEAKKQRRREGREQGRRRVPIITEAEFLARREAVERVMVVRQHGERTQIGVLEDDVLVEHYVNKEQSASYVGNVYLGKVQNVLPSMEAAFVDIGKGRNAVLYAGEVNFESLGMGHGPRRIEAALKSGQPVLVQVTKDPIGHKGARLTSQISLPGRYLVYVPEGSMTGISRKLPDTERARLKQILKKIVPDDAGVIVRTAAEGATEDELTRDVERLQAQWQEIQKKAKKGNAPTLLHGEPDMTVRVVRDIFNEDFSKVVVSGDEAWSTIHGYVSGVAPDLAGRLEKWTSEVDVFAGTRIDEQLMKALDRKVYLPSGGSLVIDRTEAMVVIDVNTGRFTGQGGNLEETVTRNNLEAAEEIVRQLRLRDLGGIIVVDFIDMVLESNRDLVLRRLLECLGRDRTKHQVAEVTSLGLVQMTRKRVGQGLLESFSEPCVHCNGRGVIVHLEQPQGSGGGGKKSRKKQKQADAAQQDAATQHDHGDHDEDHGDHDHDHGADRATGDAARDEADATGPLAADEELYSSVAEAEDAARRG
ncbi:Rne/Rng family ribonuclease, partial [Streptomyces bohaiensis]